MDGPFGRIGPRRKARGPFTAGLAVAVAGAAYLASLAPASAGMPACF